MKPEEEDDNDGEVQLGDGVESSLHHAWLYISQYGSYLLFALALAVLGYQVYSWYQTQQQRKLQNAWAELSDATGSLSGNGADPAKIRTLIAEYDIKGIQAQAYASLGDFYLDVVTRGGSPLDKVKVTSDQARQEAADAYNKVLTDYADQPLAVVHARLNLGKLYEDQADWTKAREQYQTIIQDTSSKDTGFAAEAQRRIDNINQWQEPIVFGSAPATISLPMPSSSMDVPAAPAIGPRDKMPTAHMPAPTTTQPH